MKLFSITALAILIDISVSLHILEDNNAFRNEPKLPVLDHNFGMDCYSSSFYGQRIVKREAKTAYSKTINDSSMERCTFDRFPGETLFLHRIGDGYLPDSETMAEHYIMIDSAGQFLAGILQYKTYGKVVHSLCQFTTGTTYQSYEGTRRLQTDGDQRYYGSQYSQASKQPPIGSNRWSGRG